MKPLPWTISCVLIVHTLVLGCGIAQAAPINLNPRETPATTGEADDKYLPQQGDKSLSISDKTPKHETDLVDGLILNRAMTRFGHLFYREFVSAYRDINGYAQHSGLTVSEQATARSGSKITIQHNRKAVFITIVSPASRHVDKQALAAAKRVDALLQQQKQQTQWSVFTDPDLAPDEF